MKDILIFCLLMVLALSWAGWGALWLTRARNLHHASDVRKRWRNYGHGLFFASVWLVIAAVVMSAFIAAPGPSVSHYLSGGGG
jgi:hypothetical protein